MSERKIHPALKMTLEMGPIVAFFVGYVLMKDRVFTFGGTDYNGFIVVTAAFIPVLVITTAILWALTRKLSKMQIATVVMAVVFGGLSVWLNDERFFKIKPTLIYLLFGGLLGIGLLRGQSWLRLVLEEAIPMRHEGWMILTKRLCAFFFALALANEVVWRMFSTEVWVSFKTFGLTIALFAFFMGQGKLLQTYGTPRKD
ncbi:inner membrane-spanning protein YciB [Falsirhodobacter halotolerans]|uniref:inner membrane-spanning protein YciB n=1 Tax=Falsirhodobacter halotolerans TaxID=1146892 RepID=UPI001FD1D80B|nr:inner membrane-spanning protein YciB [Falsirhodobacter halotolerans]MCJ8138961.1 septation protein IspZ [Falsirhodobacter halotolerans]